MTRIHVICEGQTEETFIKEVVDPQFSPQGIYLLPSIIGRPGHKGGNIRFQRLFTDVRAYLLRDDSCYCTTFFDFYGLPTSFPGRQEASQKPSAQAKAQTVIDALGQAVAEKLGSDTTRRFIPYIQMHEFEGLLFSDPTSLASELGPEGLEETFQAIRSEFATPEEINDDRETAPSKRIQRFYRQYQKPMHGSLAALEMGLDVIREECPLFDQWLQSLEELT